MATLFKTGLEDQGSQLEWDYKGFKVHRPTTAYHLFKIKTADGALYPDLTGSWTSPEEAFAAIDNYLQKHEPELAQIREPKPNRGEKSKEDMTQESIREMEDARRGISEYLGKTIKKNEFNLYTIDDPELGGTSCTDKELAKEIIEKHHLKRHITGESREWHRKYLDYRTLAEGLRVQFFWNLSSVVDSASVQFAYDNFLQQQDVDLGWIRHVMRRASLHRQRGDQPAEAWVDWVVDQWIGDAGTGPGSWPTIRARRHRTARAITAPACWARYACGPVSESRSCCF